MTAGEGTDCDFHDECRYDPDCPFLLNCLPWLKKDPETDPDGDVE